MPEIGRGLGVSQSDHRSLLPREPDPAGLRSAAGRKLGLGDIGWHTFRHTYRSWLDSVGTSMGVQQKLMRHAQIATTMNIYGDSMMESKRMANTVVQMVP